MKEKICIACGELLPATTEYFRKDGRSCASGKPVRDGLRAACRSCMKLRDQAYRATNADACREYQRKHLREGDTRAKRREQERRRLALPANRIKNNLRRRLNHAVACAVKHAPTFELIGCTPEQLKSHLEAAFLPGMTWENYGKGGWHIDHVVPCAAFDLTKESEQRNCFHYGNLKPLWGRDNMSKGKKVASRAPCSCSASLACVQWGEQILRACGLSDWKLVWTPGSAEGIAIFKTRTIHIHWPEGKPDHALMLHEIAHAVCCRPGHDSEYAHQYMRLVQAHFTPNASGQPRLARKET